MARPSRTTTIAAVVIATGFIVAALALTRSIPVEKVLGTKVYLPIFHGASTWVDIAVFLLMGVLAIVYLFTRKSGVYAWEVGMRAVGAPLWALNTALGLMAALRTWDFTGSSESPLGTAIQDPRLAAQFWLLLALGALLGLLVTLDKIWHKSVADLGFVALMVVLLGNVLLDPAKKALHPDNPVLNSGMEIKGPFFGIVACLGIAALVTAWIVSRYVRASLAEQIAAEGASVPEAALPAEGEQR